MNKTLNCSHGIPMDEVCNQCGIEFAQSEATRIAQHAKPVTATEVKASFDTRTRADVMSDKVKCMDDAVQDLSRNVADLTSVARALLAVGERISPEPEFMEVPNFVEVKRGPVTDEEMLLAEKILFGRGIHATLRWFARRRGVL